MPRCQLQWYIGKEIQEITCKNYNCTKEGNKTTKMIEHNKVAFVEDVWW